MSRSTHEFMRASDAFSWRLERTPAMRSTVVTVAWLTRSPGWDNFLDAIDIASQAVPRFRQRVVIPPARLSPPLWVDDAGFDLADHVCRLDSPSPGSSRVVLDLAGTEAMTPFVLTRPLWMFTLVEHMENDRAALIMKVHHSLTDGIGGIQLALQLFDQSSRSSRDRPGSVTAARAMNTAAVVRASLAHRWSQAVSTGAGAMRSSWPTAERAARHPINSCQSLLDTGRSVAETVAPVTRILSPVMTERSVRRRLEMISVPLDGLEGVARGTDCTVNDAFLAALTGGMRLYHLRHGLAVEELRVAMPVSIRTASDPLASNRITLMRFALPVADSDPAARTRLIHRRSLKASTAPSLALTDSIAAGLNLLPPAVVSGMLKRIDFVASDVVGFPSPVFLAGARVSDFVAFGPTIGTAINFTLLSYDHTCHLGMTVDAAAVPDPEDLVSCIQHGFDEVVSIPHRPRHVSTRHVGGPKTLCVLRGPFPTSQESLPCADSHPS